MEGDKRGMTSGREGDRRRERGGGGGLAGSIGGIMGKNVVAMQKPKQQW